MSDNLDIARQWVAKAESDLLNVDNNLRADRIPFDTVCFHCQQAVEKLFKAFLAANGSSPPRTHDLLLLLESVLSFEPDAESLRETCSLLAPYAVEIRYPDDWFMPSRNDADEARKAVHAVLDWLQNAHPQLFLFPTPEKRTAHLRDNSEEHLLSE